MGLSWATELMLWMESSLRKAQVSLIRPYGESKLTKSLHLKVLIRLHGQKHDKRAVHPGTFRILLLFAPYVHNFMLFLHREGKTLTLY